jgi:hypothetical protein
MAITRLPMRRGLPPQIHGAAPEPMFSKGIDQT